MLTFTLCSILSFLPISFFFAGARGHRHENHPQEDRKRKADGAIYGGRSRRRARKCERRENARHSGKPVKLLEEFNVELSTGRGVEKNQEARG